MNGSLARANGATLSSSSHPQVRPALLEPRHPADPNKNKLQYSEGVEQHQQIPDDDSSADPVKPWRLVR